MDKLFQDFEPVTTQEWIEIIQKDLKGKDIKKLVRKTIDSLEFEPFYRKENTENLPTTNLLPNNFPFIRGYKENNDWAIRQDFLFKDLKTSIEKAKFAIDKGIKTIGFDFGRKADISQPEFDELVTNIDSVAFMAFEEQEKLYHFVKKSNKKFQSVFLNFDPITYKVFTGNYYKTKEEIFENLKELLNNDDKNLKPIGINLHYFANAGATPAMQLAFGIAIASEYLHFAQENKIPLEKAINNMYFNVAVSCEYFMEISKIRSLRYLFAKLIESYAPNLKDNAKTFIHGTTTRRNKTIYDAHVNMLRTTIETFGGVVGGVDSFATEPYNAVFAEPDDFAQRIAVNQQIIIKEESYTDKVADPAGGSYYVENISIKLIEEAWKLFLEIEDKGGFEEAAKSGFIKEKLEILAEKEQTLVNKGRIAILGTNKYPNSTENLKEIKVQKPFTISDIKHEKTECEPLKISRLSEKFEELRLETEKADNLPKIFMLTYGHKAMRRARADFSSNFFAVAGFKIIDNIGFETVEDGIKKANTEKADVIVLCSSDDSYLEMAEIAAKLTKNKIVVVAGDPQSRPEIEKLGIKNFINIKSNIYQELSNYQKILGIK